MTTQRERLNRDKFIRIRDRLASATSTLVVMQDYPDPDALAAAAALRELAKALGETTVSLACGGFVGRAENQALLKYLGLNVLNLRDVKLDQFDCIAMVDTQPNAGNNMLPAERLPDIVIDHHPIRNTTRKLTCFDVRSRYGSTSTMLYEYCMAAGITLSVPTATALLYGIRSDTNDLGREARQPDMDAFLALYPRSNKRILGRIRMARVPRAYFEAMRTALEAARSYGPCLVSDLGPVDNPDMVAEMADLLLRDEETSWALCLGIHGDGMLLSLRTTELERDAGKIMQRIVGRRGTGGGHTAMAGGQIPLRADDPGDAGKQLADVIRRLRRVLKIPDEAPRRLVKKVPS